jgi:hypothetical protein
MDGQVWNLMTVPGGLSADRPWGEPVTAYGEDLTAVGRERSAAGDPGVLRVAPTESPCGPRVPSRGVPDPHGPTNRHTRDQDVQPTAVLANIGSQRLRSN